MLQCMCVRIVAEWNSVFTNESVMDNRMKRNESDNVRTYINELLNDWVNVNIDY